MPCDPNIPKEDCPDCQADEEAHAEYINSLPAEPECEYCDGPCTVGEFRSPSCPCGCGGHPEACGYSSADLM